MVVAGSGTGLGIVDRYAPPLGAFCAGCWRAIPDKTEGNMANLAANNEHVTEQNLCS